MAVGDEDIFQLQALFVDHGYQVVDGAADVEQSGFPALRVIKKVAIDLDGPHRLAHYDRFAGPRTTDKSDRKRPQDDDQPGFLFHGIPFFYGARRSGIGRGDGRIRSPSPGTRDVRRERGGLSNSLKGGLADLFPSPETGDGAEVGIVGREDGSGIERVG